MQVSPGRSPRHPRFAERTGWYSRAMTEPSTDVPEADALDQRTDVYGEDAGESTPAAPPLEADPAD
ncbi:hypothetical protein GCM10009754_50680 [Amycolatopsis minnesotensis]|uniref:Uncharacterized protein n=1 Tax=Amycolatopsis minnesotensis TaxID=337894 RepID=A0ABP5CXG9_9PSEU